MSEHFLFTKPKFTARTVAKVIGKALRRRLDFQAADELEDVDGSVDVTSRVQVQVGADYLVVDAWIDVTTLRSWPERQNIPDALKDIKAAIEEFPEPSS